MEIWGQGPGEMIRGKEVQKGKLLHQYWEKKK